MNRWARRVLAYVTPLDAQLERTALELSSRAAAIEGLRPPPTWGVYHRTRGWLTKGRTILAAEGDVRVAIYEGSSDLDLSIRPEFHRDPTALELRRRAALCFAAVPQPTTEPL